MPTPTNPAPEREEPFRSLKSVIAAARKRGRIRDGLVLCENCDNPAGMMSLQMSWTGCGPCFFGEADSLDPEEFIHIEEPAHPMTRAEFCICAAIRMPSGEVIHGHRHNHCYDVVRACGVERKDILTADQGFVTSEGRFVGREEAMRTQRAAGKRSAHRPDGVLTGEVLFSEDLY